MLIIPSSHLCQKEGKVRRFCGEMAWDFYFMSYNKFMAKIKGKWAEDKKCIISIRKKS